MNEEHEGPVTPELAALGRIEKKVDAVAASVSAIERRAAIAGGVAGGVTGGLVGGLVSTAILAIKLKLGL